MGGEGWERGWGSEGEGEKRGDEKERERGGREVYKKIKRRPKKGVEVLSRRAKVSGN